MEQFSHLSLTVAYNSLYSLLSWATHNSLYSFLGWATETTSMAEIPLVHSVNYGNELVEVERRGAFWRPER